jgi:hypothetical protein
MWALPKSSMWALPKSRENFKYLRRWKRRCAIPWHTLILSRTGDRAPLANDPSTDPEAGTCAGEPKAIPRPVYSSGIKALNAGPGAEPQKLRRGERSLGTSSTEASSRFARQRRTSPCSHLFALIGCMSIFVPGFAITTTDSRFYTDFRADPFLDEDVDAGAGSRYGCFLVKIHQLASARWRATATAALPWPLAFWMRSNSSRT